MEVAKVVRNKAKTKDQLDKLQDRKDPKTTVLKGQLKGPEDLPVKLQGHKGQRPTNQGSLTLRSSLTSLTSVLHVLIARNLRQSWNRQEKGDKLENLKSVI